MSKATALLEVHRSLGGRIVDFGGWSLPVQYSGVAEEHLAVRQRCGLFDVSHMGEILIEGAGSESFVDFLLTNDISKLAVHQAMYSGMCNDQGGLVDDLVVYRLKPDSFFLVVNASNTDKDFKHILASLDSYSGVRPTVQNVSDQYSQLALQGPLSQKILQPLTNLDLSTIQTYWCKEGLIAGIPTIIARTGYTGEDGFELYVPWGQGPALWRLLMEAGSGAGLLPCGLGARDTLRLEMKYALYGHELSETTSPLETGLGWVTKLNKASDFIGKAAIQKVKQAGPTRVLVGIKSLGRAIPRQGYEVVNADGATIGIITSGTSSPSLKLPIGIASLDPKFQAVGTPIQVQVRNELHPFQVVATPFYQRSKT